MKFLLRFKNNGHVCQSIGNEEDSKLSEDQIETELDNALSESEIARKEAEAHVKQYKAQRDYKSKLESRARKEVAEKVDFKQRNHCLTIDMGQNLGLPNFEAEQVGDTYYLSPLTIFVFGVNDDSRPGGISDKMNVYIWSEGSGKRGANNIASCLLKDYTKRGFFNDGLNKGSLNVIADNCGGQNKNEDVIRFHAWMVEAGWFNEVNLVFFS